MPPLKRIAFLFFLTFAVSAGAAAALVEPSERLADETLETRARALSAELRCLVCQNQSIDESSAPFARDMRLLIRERLRAGDSEADIRAFLTARYGEYILLRPTMRGANLLLWLSPLALLLFAAAAMWWYYRPWRARPPANP